MAYSAEFRAEVEERLGSLIPIRTKPMFGGLGIYSGDFFFALVDDDRLYFKVGPINELDFNAVDAEWFVPFDGAKPMGYRELPVFAWSDDGELLHWCDKAIAVAEAAKRPRSAKKPRT